MRNIENVLEERGLCYDESHFWNNEIIGKEITRFNWRNMKYKGHFKTVKGIKHFDEYIMDELKALAEKNQMLNACRKSAI